MFEQRRYRTTAGSAIGLLELIFISTVRNLRQTHSSAVLGLVISVAQAVVMIMAFRFMFSLLGVTHAKIRGDLTLYIMSGVFLFLTHNKAIGAVFGSAGPVSPIMLHAPMNTIVIIASSALASLYTQVLTVITILFLYHALFTPITIHDPVGAMGMLVLSWFVGCVIGLVFLAAKPWAPRFVQILKMVYQRANLVASGKMFVANMMPGYLLAFFTWNPLFHTIDQARGYTFLNYNPHYSSLTYPVYVSLALLMIGLIGEFFTRKHASASWPTQGQGI